jgi:hypothetical protein
MLKKYSIPIASCKIIVQFTFFGRHFIVSFAVELPWIPEPSTVNNKLTRREGSYPSTTGGKGQSCADYEGSGSLISQCSGSTGRCFD